MVAIGPTGPITKSATVPVPEFKPPMVITPNFVERSRIEGDRVQAKADSDARSRLEAAEARLQAQHRARFRNVDFSV